MSRQDLVAYRLLIADVYELAGTSRRTSDALASQMGQTSARWHVLSVLSDGPRTTASVARRLGLTRQSVQRVVDDLLATGHLDRQVNPHHTRAALLALTDAGRAALTAVVRDSDVDRARLLAKAALRSVDLNAARQVLRRLLEAAEADPAV